MATGKLVPKGTGKVIGKGRFVEKKREVPDKKKRIDRYVVNPLLKKRA